MVGAISGNTVISDMLAVQRVQTPPETPAPEGAALSSDASLTQAQAVLESAAEAGQAVGEIQISLLREGLDIGRTMASQMLSMIQGAGVYQAGASRAQNPGGTIDVVA